MPLDNNKVLLRCPECSRPLILSMKYRDIVQLKQIDIDKSGKVIGVTCACGYSDETARGVVDKLARFEAAKEERKKPLDSST